MKILSIDSPLMKFLSTAFDFLFLCILTFIMSLPIITAGAAFTAKYYVSMRIIRKRGPAIIKSYFKAFKDNFKQSTTIWLVQLVIIALVVYDWLFIYEVGWSNVNVIYRALIIVASLIVLFINMTVYAFIARFKVNFLNAMKGAVVYAMFNFVFLSIIVILIGVTAFLCFWYFSFLPLVLVVGVTGISYLHSLLLVRSFKKMEEIYEDKGIVEENISETEEKTEKIRNKVKSV